jgi:tetrahydromethanopterin S-methyltransferase subunit A
MLKVNPSSGYPPLEGRYMRGDDFSPVAVAIILNAPDYKIPHELQELVQAAIDGGAALSGMVQTENIGIEKIVCNVVANPNIRYLVIGGPESEGHLTGEAVKAFLFNGLDNRRQIIGTKAPVPLLLNLPMEYIDRFRKQLSLIDLQYQGDPALMKNTVLTCCREKNVGPYPEPPLSGAITWRVTQPWTEPTEEKEREARKRVEELQKRLQERSKKGR